MRIGCNRHFAMLTALCCAVFLAGCQALAATPVPLRSAAAAVPPCPTPGGTQYVGQNLTDTNFSALAPGSLVNANFSNAILKGAIFAGQDLTGASFQNAVLSPSGKGGADFTSTTLTNTCFTQATLDATDFTYANLNCTDFSNTSLMQAQFGPSQNIVKNPNCRTKFNNSILDVHAITTDHWGSVDFSNAKFQNLSASTFSLANTDISGAILVGTNFSNIDMQGANLSLVDFSNANLTRANLTSAALNGARLNGASAAYAKLDCAEFYGGARQSSSCGTPVAPACSAAPRSAAAATGADLTRADFQGASLASTLFDFANLAGANLTEANAQQSSFRRASLQGSGMISVAVVQGADLSGANFQNANVNSVQFNSTILAGACFDRTTTLNNTGFIGSIMPGATFDGAVMEGVSFYNTILENAVFTNAMMKTAAGGGSAVSFSCAQLGGSNFQNAVVTGANFQSAVMPPAAACCPQADGSAWCGTVDLTQRAYGGVIYPVLAGDVTCPSGVSAQCSAADWQIASWQTSACGGGNRVMWSKPDCGGTPGTMVNFKDPNLKACILASLPGAPGSISVKTAATLLEVSCPGAKIADLTGLQDFTALTSLDLSSNQITQFSLSLNQLQKLKLENNQLTALDVSGMPGLVQLDVSGNQLGAILGLVAINPKVLDASHNKLTSFDLPVMTNLVFADLSYNLLTNVLDKYNTNLAALTSLGYLDLSSNTLTTIGDASALATAPGSLSSLFLACNASFNCASLNLKGTDAALQSSRCAQFNAQSGKWITQPFPSCPAPAQRARKQAR